MLNQADPTFGHLRQTMDTRMKQLTASGVGTVPKRAQAISKDEEALWTESVFNLNSSQGLTYIVFFYNCKLFGLSGGLSIGNFVENSLLLIMIKLGDICSSWEGHLRIRKEDCTKKM